jgi:class 3 adenylate cyclase
MHWLTLAFSDAELERQYQRDRLPTTLLLMRTGFVNSLALWMLGLVVVLMIHSPGRAETLRAALGVMLPLLVAALVLTRWTHRPLSLQFLGAIPNVVAGWCVVYVAGGIGFDRYAGELLILIGISAFMRLRFVTAALSFLLVFAAYALACLFRPGAGAPRIIDLSTVFFGVLLLSTISRLAERATREAFSERLRSENLLRNMLPEAIAERLKREPGAIADSFDAVSVLFADIAGFTPMSERMAPGEVVGVLNQVFSAFDEMAKRHGLEKIKTIGDAYMVVAGLPVPRADHEAAIAAMALEMREAVTRFGDGRLMLRLGIHSGPVVAGVIGTAKYSYDLWGDTVNTARSSFKTTRLKD